MEVCIVLQRGQVHHDYSSILSHLSCILQCGCDFASARITVLTVNYVICGVRSSMWSRTCLATLRMRCGCRLMVSVPWFPRTFLLATDHQPNSTILSQSVWALLTHVPHGLIYRSASMFSLFSASGMKMICTDQCSTKLMEFASTPGIGSKQRRAGTRSKCEELTCANECRAHAARSCFNEFQHVFPTELSWCARCFVVFCVALVAAGALV